MDITLDTEKDTVYGTTVVELTNTTGAPLSELCFRLYSANICYGSILSAENAVTGKEYAIDVKKDPSVIYLSLGEDCINPSETLTVELSFESGIPTIDDRFAHITDTNGDLYNLSFCFPQIAFLEDGKWHEDEYVDTGESYYNPMSDYNVTLHAPSEYVVLSSGKSISKDGTTTIAAPNVREMAITLCNFAEIKTAKTNDITVNILMPRFSKFDEACLADLYDTMLTLSVDALEIYNNCVGQYIYDELDVIPTFFAGSVGGMEMPGLVQIGLFAPDETQQLPEDFYVSVATSLVHEIGHQWFYCAVGNNTSKEPWLDESFTSYLHRYYLFTSEVCWQTLSELSLRYNTYAEDFDSYSFRYLEIDETGYINLPVYKYSDRQYSELVYEKGSWLLRELELCMGSDAFFEMLGDWYKTNTGSIVTGKSFVSHVLKYNSSDSVKEILNKYLSDKAI